MGRVALVSGASRGIGRGIAKALAQAGYTVAANYRSDDEAAASLAAESGVKTYKWDVSDYDACVAGVEKVVADLGPVEVLRAVRPECTAVLQVRAQYQGEEFRRKLVVLFVRLIGGQSDRALSQLTRERLDARGGRFCFLISRRTKR